MSELTPEDAFATWKLQDTLHAGAIDLVSQGAHLGALCLAKHITLSQIKNGNRTLTHDEMMRLVKVAQQEVTEESLRNIYKLRNP